MKLKASIKSIKIDLFKTICEKILLGICVVRGYEIVFSNNFFAVEADEVHDIRNAIDYNDEVINSMQVGDGKSLKTYLKINNKEKNAFYYKYSDDTTIILLKNQSILNKNLLNRLQKLALDGELAGSVLHEVSNFLMMTMCHLDDLIDPNNNTVTVIDFDCEYYVNYQQKLLENRKTVGKIKSCIESASKIIRRGLKVFQQSETKNTTVEEIYGDISDFNLFKLQLKIEDMSEYFNKKLNIQRTHLRQILLNLIKNAVEASNESEVIVYGKLHVQKNDCIENFGFIAKNGIYFQISVQDSGAGIKIKDMNNLFSYCVSSKKNGSGIGLTVVKSLLKEVGGFLTLDTKEDQGTTFNIFIPLVKNIQLIDSNRMYKGNIIVLEDCRIIRKKIIQFCQELGYQAMGVNKISELKTIDLTSVDIMIIDKNLNNNFIDHKDQNIKDGHDIIGVYKDYYPSIKFISISGFDNQQDDRFISLHKPFSKDDLYQTLEIIHKNQKN